MPGRTCHCGGPASADGWCARCRWWSFGEPAALAPQPAVGLDARGIAIAVVNVLVLVAGLVQVGRVHEAERREIRARFDAAVTELATYVERAQGAPFTRPVEAELLGDDEFLDALYASEDAEDVPGEDDVPADFGTTMHALRLADSTEDAVETADEVLSESVVGFYDSDADTLYVRGRSVTPFVRLVIVHELVHAWQDQHYDLDAVEAKASDADADLAIDALVEGDATRVEEAWRAEQSAADLAEIERVESSGAGDDEPSLAERTLGALYEFPYSVGTDFVTALHDAGGNAAVARAFRAPPVSTEQVLHPEAYLRRERPKEVPDVAERDDVVDGGVLGELGLILVLARGRFDAEALTAAAGWGGDAYVTYDDGVRACTEAYVVMDSPAARDRLVKGLRRKASGPDESVTPRGRDAVELRYCVASLR